MYMGDNGDLQDLSIQCLPYITIQFNLEEIISLSLKLCKHLQNDLPSKKEHGEEKYNDILRQCIVITNSIKSMCKSNILLIELSKQNNPNNKIPTPHLLSKNTKTNANDQTLSESPLLLPNTAFSTDTNTQNDNDNNNEDDTKMTNNDTINHENITQLIQSLSSLLLNIIASKQQSMKIAFEKHIKKQQQLLSNNKASNTSGSIQNEIIISFEHYHEQILFALDILSTIIDNHGQNVSFIFESATSVLLQLLSGAHHDYSDKSKSKSNITITIRKHN